MASRYAYPSSSLLFGIPVPESVSHFVDFLREFLIVVFLPVVCIIFAALISVGIFLHFHRAWYARYATPEELYDEALGWIKKDRDAKNFESSDGRSDIVDGERRRRRKVCVGSWLGREPSTDKLVAILAARRIRALENLRLCLALQPGMGKARLVLATELLYGEINGDAYVPPNGGGGVGGKSKERSRSKAAPSSGGLRRRTVAVAPDSAPVSSSRAAGRSMPRAAKSSEGASPALEECRTVVRAGLQIDPMNANLLKLDEEVEALCKYGRNGAHARMMNVGSFGWTADVKSR